jgi:methionyl-tRNA formyltransferase
MEKLRIVFCGTPEVAIPSLLALAADPAFEISLVITQPDRPKGRGLKIQPSPVAHAGEELDLPVAKPQDINDLDFRSTQFDFLVVVAYGQLLKKEILQLPTIAPVNLHFSLLPRWRGASPVEHAILHGDEETGVSVIRITEKLDAGPILAQEKVPLTGRETTPQLKERLAEMGARLLAETLKKPLTPREQTGDASVCRKITKHDGHIDLSALTAEEVHRRVRAFTKWPGVTTEIDGQPIKLIATSLIPTSESTPLLCAENTTMYATKIRIPGRNVVTGKEWQHGRMGRTWRT